MDQHSAPVGTDDVYAALPRALELATDYLQGLPHRPVDANTSYDEVVDALSGPLPEEGTNAVAVVERLAATEVYVNVPGESLQHADGSLTDASWR